MFTVPWLAVGSAVCAGAERGRGGVITDVLALGFGYPSQHRSGENRDAMFGATPTPPRPAPPGDTDGQDGL